MEIPIIFDQSDHTDRIPHPRTYPLIIELIMGSKHLSEILMDGGSNINVMYVETLNGLGIARSVMRPSMTPIHGIMPRHNVHHLTNRFDRYVQRPIQFSYQAIII